MSIITIDFETYYDKEYSLSKMTTEEYINDPRFEVIGVGIKIDDGETEWEEPDALAGDRLLDRAWDWSEHAILCHNTLFDGFILAQKYGIVPGMWFDTLSMARAIHGVEVGGSLKALASRYQIGEKGDEVITALGKRRADFDSDGLHRYGDYCRNDVDLTHRLFDILSKGFPDDELKLIDLTIRMFTEPTFKVDDALLIERLKHIKAEKLDLLHNIMGHTAASDEADVQKILSSNPQFAALLKTFSVDPPMKISPTTGKETYAFAKTDEGFMELQDHPDPIVQQLCAVRLGTKSTIEESRVERFIGIGGRNRGRLPVPLRYYGAHTGRWSGSDSVNFHNLPSRDKAKKALKNSIVAPDGHVIINSDSSQIEARVLAWLAGQQDVVDAFAEGRDVYSEFASKVFKRPITRDDPIERFVGKTCVLGLGYGTGAAKLQSTLKLGGADLSLDVCQEMVSLYRRESYKITALWRDCDLALQQMMSGMVQEAPLGSKGIHYGPLGVRLPNGLHIRYPKLHMSEGKIIYDSRRGPVSIWGGGMVENIVQALARIIVGQQMLWLAELGYRPALTVHDSIVFTVRERPEILNEALLAISRTMSTAPSWALGLPVTCEVKFGKTYGEV
jgi:DNA polymerase I-like protein with 3'-5' exonuclease and polymerase domains